MHERHVQNVKKWNQHLHLNICKAEYGIIHPYEEQ